MPDLRKPPLMISGVTLLLQAMLKILAKLRWLITVQVTWLKAAQAHTHPLLSGSKRDRSRGCKRCEECAGRQKTRTLFAVAVSISSAVTWALWPSTSNSTGRSGGIHLRNNSLNHWRKRSFSIQPDFWPANKVPAGEPSWMPFGTPPLGLLKMNIGGMLLPAADAHTNTVTFLCWPLETLGTCFAPLAAATILLMASNSKPLSSQLKIRCGFRSSDPKSFSVIVSKSCL